MTGFSNIFIAIKPSRSGNCVITAVMGTDTEPFANLRPVNPATALRGRAMNMASVRADELFNDPAENLTADVWNIIWIQSVLQDQKNMQFKITNNSGGNSDIQFAFMRTV
tara:strand:- start:915 stop:1244 length:330 start_codon:yes stop_codon:yes gene_type:complete